MKLTCKLCGEEFDSKELETENDEQSIIITCPNACYLMIIDIDKIPDIIINE